MRYYSLAEFKEDVYTLTGLIKPKSKNISSVYGIPRGGIPLALELSRLLEIPIVDESSITKTTLIVDDLVDSGLTLKPWMENKHITATIHVKDCSEIKPNFFVDLKPAGQWIEYWWEKNEKPAEDSVIRLLQMIGEDVKRDGLRETPKRVINAYKEMFSGYNLDPKDIIKTFDDNYDQIVLLKDVEFYSNCEHHLLPFWGKAHIAYIPNGKVIGISKLARILDVYTKRAQIQERIGDQVVKALMDNLKPVGAACILEAAHLCMRMRGIQKQNSVMTTSSLGGVFLEDTDKGRAARKELMDLIGK